jgi:multidrug efflux pump subunit AcrA (membrane-fusion protein)
VFGIPFPERISHLTCALGLGVWLVAVALAPAQAADSTGVASATEAAITPAAILIPMDDRSARAAGISTIRVAIDPGRSELSFPGTVIIPQQQIRIVAAPAGGIVETLLVGQDENVTIGQVVALVRSPEIVEAQRNYLAALSDDALASDKLRRARLLFEGKATPERELRIAETEASIAKAKLEERAQLLLLLGMSKDEFETLQSTRVIASMLTLRSPIDGTVVTRHVGVGEQIKAAASIFTLGVLAPLRINIQVPAQRLSSIAEGAAVAVPAYRVQGKIIRIGRTVDPATQSAIAVAEVDPAGRLRPGLAVTTVISVDQTPAADGGTVWSVPLTSVVRHREQSWVFLHVSGGFRAVPVQVVAEQQHTATVRAAFTAQDEIAARGVLALLSELVDADKEN